MDVESADNFVKDGLVEVFVVEFGEDDGCDSDDDGCYI